MTVHSFDKLFLVSPRIEASHWVQMRRYMRLLEEQVEWVWMRLIIGLVKDRLLGLWGRFSSGVYSKDRLGIRLILKRS